MTATNTGEKSLTCPTTTKELAELTAEEPVGESPSPKELYNPNRVFSTSQLDILEILVHPVWIFDIDNKCMRWANASALEVWNAPSLQELQERDFQDMSEATARRLQEYQCKFQMGQRVTDHWTVFPRGQPKPIQVNCSGVKLNQQQARPCMLVEGIPLVRDEILNETMRGVEMLRHLPIPVCQFDMNGKVLFQNPEAMLIPSMGDEKSGSDHLGVSNRSTASPSFANTAEAPITQGEESSRPKKEHKKQGENVRPMGDFLDRFVNQEVAQQMLQDLQSNADSVEAQAEINTRHGPRSCAVQLRKVVDPVTAEPVILYSARDLTDAIQAKKEREAREKKSEFLAIMAHEIRTPLHQITGFIDLLDQTTDLNSEQQSYVKLLKSCAQGLMTVISDVLDYSKLEAGKMKLENIPFEPLSVTEGSMEAVRSSCEEKGLYLTLDWHKDIPFRMSGDPNRLRQILLNLLSNAAKFTKEGGIHVEVLIKQQLSSQKKGQTMLHFRIKDTGIGIQEEHQRFVFNQYNQGSVSIARNYGGTGLGLSICKSLVSKMGGNIGVESVFGKGSSFWFSLPALIPVEREFMEQNLEETTDNFALSILVAEDNKINQKLMERMLDRMGHKCTIAANGKEAIERIQEEKFDVCL